MPHADTDIPASIQAVHTAIDRLFERSQIIHADIVALRTTLLNATALILEADPYLAGSDRTATVAQLRQLERMLRRTEVRAVTTTPRRPTHGKSARG